MSSAQKDLLACVQSLYKQYYSAAWMDFTDALPPAQCMDFTDALPPAQFNDKIASQESSQAIVQVYEEAIQTINNKLRSKGISQAIRNSPKYTAVTQKIGANLQSDTLCELLKQLPDTIVPGQIRGDMCDFLAQQYRRYWIKAQDPSSPQPQALKATMGSQRCLLSIYTTYAKAVERLPPSSTGTPP